MSPSQFLYVWALPILIGFPTVVYSEVWESPQLSEKYTYYDLTSEINKNLYENNTEWDISAFFQNISKENSANVFYSTDKYFHKMLDLSAVTELLDENGLDQSKVYLSFQLLKNSYLTLSRFSDVFYDLPVPDNASKSIKSLQKHVSGILVELNKYPERDCPSSAYTAFEARKIDFLKYARAIGNAILVDTENEANQVQFTPPLQMKVGLLFNESSESCEIAKSQQKRADFVTYGVNFAPVGNFPLSYSQFKKYLNKIVTDYQYKLFYKRNQNEILFKINLGSSPECSYSPYVCTAYVKILERSEPFYLQRLQSYAETWTKEEKISDLILKFELTYNSGLPEISEKNNYLIPKLYVQEVDVNPCQLETMLGTVAKHYKMLVVNEFTWSAFARHSGKMARCSNSERLPLSDVPSVDLFFTPGLWKIWENTGTYFEKLLTERKSISGWNLQTLIFSGADLPSEFQNNPNYVQLAVVDFAKRMSQAQGYSIGCAVRIERVDNTCFTGTSSQDCFKHVFNRTVTKPCKSIWDVSSVIVIQFDSVCKSPFQNQQSSKDHILVLMTLLSELFSKEFPDKEVILEITNLVKSLATEYWRTIPCQFTVSEWMELQKQIQSWAEIHQVKVIFGDAFYNDNNPTRDNFGLWKFPSEDGKAFEVDAEVSSL